jgi:acetyl-CoA carboxylase carboxyltransferase component
MIEGGGLGRFAPEEVGPIDVQSRNGVVDVRVADEAAAVATARKVLGYFQGALPTWSAGDQVVLREALPENRRRAYRIRPILETVADAGSLLELRAEFGRAVVTALGRIEGRPVGMFANDPCQLAGAIDTDAADKIARFLQLCDAFGLPVISFCDTPGFMVGPKAEATALVRHASRVFAAAASLQVPLFTVVLRRGFGLGAQAVAGGHFHAPVFTVSWPTGEFGAMGLEGAARLALRGELAAIEDPQQREALVQAAVAAARERGTALHMASLLELDAVIDPAETRSWLARGLRAAPCPPPRRRFIDTW